MPLIILSKVDKIDQKMLQQRKKAIFLQQSLIKKDKISCIEPTE
jgi:hypothetical protein